MNETETIKLNLTQNNTQNEFDTFDNMISNYDNDVKLNGLFCFVFCFFFGYFHLDNTISYIVQQNEKVFFKGFYKWNDKKIFWK